MPQGNWYGITTVHYQVEDDIIIHYILSTTGLIWELMDGVV